MLFNAIKMEQKKPLFKIYSSSAGSGKTYTLTKEYLKLALVKDSADYFRHILAITFTNDATNEMKERIVKDLFNFAYFDKLEKNTLKKSEDKLEQIAKELQQDKEILRERARKIFGKILYNYADFSVSTIDKFVNKVTNAFTRELELPYNYEIELDHETLVKNATDRVLEKIGQEQNKTISDFVMGWIKEKIGDGEDWATVGEELVSVAKQLSNEKAYQSIQNLMLFEIEDFENLRKHIKDYIKNTEKKIKELGKKALDIIDLHQIPHEFFSSGAIPKYFQKATSKLKDLLAGTGIDNALKMFENDKWTPQKPKKELADFSDALESIKPAIKQIADEIESIRTGESKQRLYLYELIDENLPKLALLKEIEKELEDIKKENNSIHISDSTKKIAEIIATEPVPYIYERVGEKYNHILIDEFQDTSVLQWHNLLPLIENGLSEGNFNLIVGDAKQAIYRWRGGEMEQLVYLYNGDFDNLAQFADKNKNEFSQDRYSTLAQYFTPENLNSNYRSTKEIISFNNHFFETLKNTPFGEMFPLLPKVYDKDFAQIFPERDDMKGGRVEIEFLEGKNKEETTLEALNKTYQIIINLKNEGWSLGDITLLVRKNKEGSSLAVFLKEKGINIVSAEALLLSNDDRVVFMVAMLKVLYRPDDKMSKHIALTWFYKIVKKHILTPEENNLIGEITEKSILFFYDKFREEGFELNFIKLATLNLYELAEKIIGIFGLLENQPKLEYLFRFLDVLLQFNQQKQATLGDFVEYWDKKKDSLSINANASEDAVIITTIHKSKGLEYPIVIMPFVDWDLYPRHTSTLWIDLKENDISFQSKGKTKTLDTSLVYYDKKLTEVFPHIALQYHIEKEKSFLENMNLLYVAFTRPVYRLYLLAKNAAYKKEPKNASEAERSTSVAHLLRMYVEHLNQSKPIDITENPPQIVVGETNVIKNGTLVPVQKHKKDEDEIFWLEDMISTDIHKKLKLKNLKKKKKQ